MNKERFLRIFMVICVLFAVSRADSDNTVNGSGMEQTMTNTERGNGPELRKELREELKDRILTQKEVLKQRVLLAAGAPESDILLFDYDDYDGDGKYEAFMIVGECFTYPGGWGEETSYTGTLYFAGADGSVLELDDSFGIYRMIDGKMDFGSRKYLYFYTEYIVLANDTELWTVRDGKPVDESELFRGDQVVYRDEYPREDFEIWADAYDHSCEKDGLGKDDPLWTGHTWKPYFYHYNRSSDQLEAYAGEEISKETFAKLSGSELIEEIEAKGYIVGEIIHWENDIITINYHEIDLWGEGDSQREVIVYENVIWDNRVKDYWRKEERGVTSWENAGEWGSYRL